ncbi:MAG: hypothetical protein HYV75_09755 [Opitutae bacterium]|nr:hypothetical protein [Opitutae bacterium]
MLLVSAGLLLPGAGWALAMRWPLPWFAAGVLSALAILAGVVGFALGRKGRAAPSNPERSDWWLALPALPLVGVAICRAWAQPLAGADVDFRWNHLAGLIVQTGHLDYYPPVSALAFTHYFWADGIAPLVSSLYAWTYFAAGSTARTWTALPVLLQFAALLALLHGLGKLWGGDRAGWLACAVGGATMLLQFAFGLGQETGLTALGAGGLVFYLVHWQRSRCAHLLVPAAACAALATCAREYGALFFLAGLGWVALAGGRWREILGFALGAAALPAAWHLRNWALTGNPLYAHNLGGLFPANPVFSAWMQGYVEAYGQALRSSSGWREIFRLLLLSSVPALGGLVCGAVLLRKQPGWAGSLAIALAAVAAWVSSVPFTAGGLFYSMRVLSPLLVIGCAWGGVALAGWVPGRRHLAGLLLGLGLFGADAALRAWTIPINPYTIPPREWPGAGYRLQRDFTRHDLPFIDTVARSVSGKVLSESAGVQHVFRAHGREFVPLWSPEVAFLFGTDYQGDAVTRLRELGFTHLLLTRVQSSVDFLARTGALTRLTGRIHSVMANDTFVLFALDAAPPAGPKP